MNKKSLIAVMTFFLLVSNSAFGSSIMYDDANEILYIGGFEIDRYRYEIEKGETIFGSKIYAIEAKNNKAKLLINSDAGIYAYEISVKGYIAVSTSISDKGDIKYTNRLHIYNRSGNKIEIIDDVCAKGFDDYVSWAGDGVKIVYVKCNDYIEGRDRQKGVFMYDLDKKKEIMISKWCSASVGNGLSGPVKIFV